jgi:TolB-like protein/Flp pilus assembly protein TadD
VSDRLREEGDSVWHRLRRRKVVQWGIVYGTFAWGLLQGVAHMHDTFGWPLQLQKAATVLLILGLPVVLVLAWYHGDKGQQRVTASEAAILTLLFLVGGAIFWRYDQGNEPSPAMGRAPYTVAQPIVAQERPSIAVLPFENRSRLADDAFFVDGIHDDILTQLSKIGAMKVIARTSVEQFRDTDLTAREIGEKLGVGTVLDGGVQRSGDRVRVTVQLVDTATDAHIWAESYDRQLTAANLFAIQTEVAAAIAAALKGALTPSERARTELAPTLNLKAWEAYQLGKQRMASRASAGMVDAEQFFREAIQLDPSFARAYVGLADALSMQVVYSGAPKEPGLDDAEKALDTALRMDPGLAEAWATAGLIARYRLQLVRAEAMYRRAIELNPNYATARHWYSTLLRDLGRPDEALVQIEQALELDPLSGLIHLSHGQRLEALGRFDEAESAYRRAVRIDPSGPFPWLDLANLKAYAFDQFVEAIPLAVRATELDAGGVRPASELAGLFFDLGDDEQFAVATTRAERRWPHDEDILVNSALLALMRRDADEASRRARLSLDADPRHSTALLILRDIDLRAGRYGATLARYKSAYPELFVAGGRVDGSNYWVAIDVALVADRSGNRDLASALLEGAERAIQAIPRLGGGGYWISDAQIHALRGETAEALAALREAAQAGWRGRGWRYHRDFDLSLASIRDEPEFKAVFADIDRDMARQRAELAALPTDAPPDLGAAD